MPPERSGWKNHPRETPEDSEQRLVHFGVRRVESHCRRDMTGRTPAGSADRIDQTRRGVIAGNDGSEGGRTPGDRIFRRHPPTIRG